MTQTFDIFTIGIEGTCTVDSSELKKNLLIPENPLITDEHTGVSGMNHINEYLVDVASMISQS